MKQIKRKKLKNNRLTESNYLSLGGGTYTFRIPSNKVIAFSGKNEHIHHIQYNIPH